MQLNKRVEFFRDITGFEPWKYQAKFLKCNKKRIAVRSGRQVGKTTMCAIKILYEAFVNDKTQILVIAPIREQSKYLFQMIKDFIKKFPDIQDSIERETATMMFFKNGSRIYCLSGAILSKDRIRGFSPSLIIIDEAAFVPDETFNTIKPMIIKTRGDINLVGTPYGKRGFFYEAFSSDSEYKKFHIKCEECPGILKKDLKKFKKKEPEIRYLQEYEGEFTAESDVYFNPELIDKGIEDIKQIDEPESNRQYFLGVDCARMGEDETIYIIRDDIGNVIKILSDSMKPSTVIIGRIKYLNDIFKFQIINIDEAGTGGAVKDVLFSEALPINGHKFSIVGKEEIYRNLKSLMEHGLIKYPKHDKLISQMKDLRMSHTLQGTRIQPPLGRHDDYPDALALAFKDMKVIKEEEKEDFFVIT